MVFRKIENANSVKYIPKNEQTGDRDINPNTIKNSSLPRKQNKKPSQSNKKNYHIKDQHQVLKQLGD